MRYVETTHAVENQPPPLADYDAYGLDTPLREAVEREAQPWLSAQLARYGQLIASSELIELGVQANRFTPELRTHDRYGHRIDEVAYHPAYHGLMAVAMEHEVHSISWSRGGPGAQLAHAALLYLHAQVESGTCCPLTMTHAAVPALRSEPSIARVWEPRLLASSYDERSLPAADKRSATIGMAMTEKQGGSDVRANSTRARPIVVPGSGEAYELYGHKWFCSAPMSDAFLTLAQAAGGLTCFLVPRWLPNGSRNRLLLQRLKDKLGNRSNASSELEYDRTWALAVGDEGRGVATILQMVAQTRVDCAAGSAGLMRQALVQALHHARHRVAFGKRLIEQPLMQRVLADLALESEAATVLALRVARAYDQPSEGERLLARAATAIAKYWVTRRAPPFVFEAMECLGGAGYVEESVLPRLYREAPVNSIWEGSGNVQCLDVVRALQKEPQVADELLSELALAAGANRHLDVVRAQLERELREPSELAVRARSLVEQLAIALSASQLVRHAPSFVADAYCESRLGGARGFEYGTLRAHVDLAALLQRAWAGP
jgi:putative acyl-CoA dehydrogenase